MDIMKWIDERRRIADEAPAGPWTYVRDVRSDGMKVFRVGSIETGDDLLSVPRYRDDDDGDEIALAVVDAQSALPKVLDALADVIGEHENSNGECLKCPGKLDAFESGFIYESWPCPVIRTAEKALGEIA